MWSVTDSESEVKVISYFYKDYYFKTNVGVLVESVLAQTLKHWFLTAVHDQEC